MSLELDGDTVLDGNVVSQCKMNGEAITTLTRCFDKHGRQGDYNGRSKASVYTTYLVRGY